MKTRRTLIFTGAASLSVIATTMMWPTPPPRPSSAAPAVAPRAERGSPAAESIAPEAVAPAVAAVEVSVPQPDFAKLDAFDGWVETWNAASPGARALMAEEGADLAAARRPEFKALIMTDPRQALERAVSRVTRQDLPASIVAQLEEPVSTTGDLNLLVSTPSENAEPGDRTRQHYIETPGRTYMAYLDGRAAWLSSGKEFPFRGVAVDRELAVAANPVRRLEIGERIPAGAVIDETCPVSGKTSETVAADEPIAEENPTVEIAGKLVALCEPAHVSGIEKQYAYEGGWGSGSATFYNGLKPSTNWGARTGIYRWLYIPVIYDEELSHPITREQAEQDVADAARFWAEGSFGKLKVLGTVTPPVKLPFSRKAVEAYKREFPAGTYYDEGEMLQYAAQGEARKMGYDPDSYSAIVLHTGGGGGGVAWGGRKALINGAGMGIILHEVGHLLGLKHAEARFTAGDLPYDWELQPDKGSPFDIMGRNFQGQFGMHYHSMAKQRLGWLGAESILTPSGSGGNYRIHAIDQPRLADGKSYALRAAKDEDTAYVIEYRAHTDALGRQTTVLIDRPAWGISPLLDTTADTFPDEWEDFKDAGLTPGRTYSDLEADMHFTVLAENDTRPPSIDVAYRKGPFPGNTAPVVNLVASAVAVNAGDTVTFTANANDANGDALAYHWDFGDGFPTANSAVVSRTFPVAAQVNAMVAVSDMKGGLTRRHVVINVGAHGKQLVTGLITSGGLPLANVRVTSSDGRQAFTDADGNYALAGVGSGSRTLAANLRSYTFAAGFTNPLNVASGTNTANWTATGATFVSLSKTADATEGGTAGSFTLTRTGATTTDLVVRVAKPTGTAGSGDFTVTPANGVDPAQWAYWTFTIPAGQSSRVVSVAAVDDTATEGDEVIRFQLGAGAGYETIVASTAEILIFDNEAAPPKVAVTTIDADAAEPSDSASFTFSRGGSTALPLNLNVTWGGTATNGADYALMPSPVVIAAGQSSVIVPVAVTNDIAAEAAEKVTATVTSGVGYLPDAAASSAVVTLVDDDTAIVTVEAADDSASEAANDAGIFLIHRTGSVDSELRVSYTLTGAALEGTDYEAMSGQVVIAAGAVSAPVMIAPQDDATGERPESVILTLTSPGGPYQVGGRFQDTLFIHDDGDLPSIRVRRVSDAWENGGSASFAIRAVGSVPGNLAVSYSISGTATAVSDYNHAPAVLQVPTDGSEVIVAISAMNDSLAESTETLVVTIVASASYEVMDDPVTMAVHDNDSGASRVSVCRQYPSPSFGANRLKPLRESDPLGSFYFYRASNAGAITVNYAVSGSATSGTDFTGLPGSVVIPDGSYGATVEFVPTDDEVAEGIETVTVTILVGAGYGADLAASATEEILDDEAAVAVGFQLAQSTASESGGGFHDLAVTLSAASATTVNVRCVGGSGSSAVGNGVDWSFVDAANGNAVLPTASLNFPAGTTSRNVRIKVIDDGLTEPAESLVLELQSPDRASLSTTTTTHRILLTDDGLNGLVKEERWSSTAVYDNNTWGTVAPAFTGYLAGFTPSQEAGEVYSRRLSGLIVAPTSGQFTFWVAADDTARLYLSSTSSPTDKTQIASVGGYTGFQNWNAQPNQTSLPITLVAGQSYYMEVQQKESGGGDHVSVAWQGPGFSRIPLAMDYVAPAQPTAVRFVSADSVSREGDGATARVLVALDRPVIGSPVSVDYTVSGTATAGSDFTLAPGTLVFAAGEQVKHLPLSILADAVGELPEAIVVSLSNPAGAALVTPTTHVITVQDAEAPTIGTLHVTANSASAAGTLVTTAAATPAAGRTIIGWTILAGNTGNAFALNAAGQLTLATPAALPNPGGMQLVIRATDDAGGTGDGLVNIICNAPANGVVEQRWNGKAAFDSDFLWTGAAGHTGTLATFTTPQNVGSDYSRRLSGYLKPTVSGDYTFWIAGDDNCRLFFSSDASPSNKSQIASVGDWTNFQAWDTTQGQKSRVIPLVAGKVYWMEVHHLEKDGGDHVSIAWQRAGSAREVIPAAVIFPNVAGLNFDSPPVPPTIVVTSPAAGAAFDTGDDIVLTANVAGGTPDVTAVEFYRGSTLIGSDALAPYGVTWTNAIAGNHALTARAVFTGGGVTSSAATVSVTDLDPAGDRDDDGFTNGLEFTLGTDPKSSASQPDAAYANLRGWWKLDETTGPVADDATGRAQDGSVSGATWSPGTDQGGLTFDGVDDSVSTPSNLLNNRPVFTISGCYKSPLTTGNRVGLWGQNDVVEFGINGSSLTIWTPGGGSASTPLPAAGEWHHVTCVGDGSTIKIYIDGVLATTGGSATANYGSSTLPFRIGGAIWDATGNHFTGEIDDVRLYERALSAAEVGALQDTLVPNRAPAFPSGTINLAATEDLAFAGQLAATDPDSGDTRTYSKIGSIGWLQVAANGALSGTPDNSHVGPNSYSVRVTDSGGLSAEATLVVTVANVNDAPVFTGPSTLPAATEDQAYAGNLAASVIDIDTGDSLVFTKVDGPEWLNVAPNGALTGTPANSDAGARSVDILVTDGSGASASAALNLAVANVNDAPVFIVDPITREPGAEGAGYVGTTLFGTAVDADAGDGIRYSKFAGPGWLSVAEDGSLSGTPPPGSAGSNPFTIRATDLAGAFDDALLTIQIEGIALPLPWDESDVGTGIAAGSATHSGGVFSLAGAGTLAGRNDSFHYVWQTLDGDGEIIARINTLQDTGTASRVGVMIRDTLATNSRHVFMGMTSDNDFRWVRRTSSNGNTSATNSATGTVPNTWVRLTRVGTMITAYKSANGTTWTQVGSLSAGFPSSCYIGLAVASGSAGTLNTSLFGNVTVTP